MVWIVMVMIVSVVMVSEVMGMMMRARPVGPRPRPFFRQACLKNRGPTSVERKPVGKV